MKKQWDLQCEPKINGNPKKQIFSHKIARQEVLIHSPHKKKKRLDHKKYPSSHNHGSVKNGCISNRIVSFQYPATSHETMIYGSIRVSPNLLRLEIPQFPKKTKVVCLFQGKKSWISRIHFFPSGAHHRWR